MKNHPPVAAFPPQEEMEHFMREALRQAEQSAADGEIPVGAVIVSDGKIIASAHNTCIADCNVSCHAEINALAQAGSEMQNYRLDGCDIYITLEPCAMCASALIQARIRRVIYGAAEPKTGAAGSIVNLFADKRLNTHTAIRGGILQEECRAVLNRFFQNKRKG
ncbi:tRNA-specific adenosine deaminase [Neisseria meningitidis M13399]|nr:tRNA-specific adenosine deaminase [Neisseria meningitidis M04-240196]EGC56751.1 tRNA-specific adenosine deaminase [Neisseria meningitidis M13399]